MEGREGPPPIEAVSPVEKLKPREFVDADGAKRQLFTFKNVRGSEVNVVFYQKEDLPFSKDILQNKEGFVLGGPPNFRNVKEWDGFLGDVRKASKTHHEPTAIHNFNRQKAVDSGEAVFFVENNPVSILDMAFILGLEGQDLRNERRAAAVDRRFGPVVNKIIDDSIAGTVVDDEGQIRKRVEQEGEALALMALMGDKDARGVLDKRRKVIEIRDSKKEEEIRNWATKTVERLSKEGISPARIPLATHTTKYKPVITEEGVEIISAFDATGGKSLRNTIHMSLAGPVDSSLGGGGWNDMDYVISGDLGEIRARNGNPRKMMEIDTWFLVPPGGRFVIPNAHLTMPGWVPEGVLSETKGRITVYKNKDLTARDVDALLLNYYDSHRYSHDLVTDRIKDCFNSVLWSSKVNDGRADQRREGYIDFIGKFNVEPVLDNMRKYGIREAIKQALTNYKQAEERDVIDLEKKLEAYMVTAIRNGGFYSTTGTSEGSKEGLELLMLAASWGARGDTSRQAHANDSEGLMMERGLAYPIFEEQRKAKDRLVQYDKETVEGADTGFRTPRHFYEYFDVGFGANMKKLPIEGRLEIMEAVRAGRGFLSDNKNTRRAHYLAGII